MVKRIILIAGLAIVFLAVAPAVSDRLGFLSVKRQTLVRVPGVSANVPIAPAWGGAGLVNAEKSPAALIDSFKRSFGSDSGRVNAYTGSGFGIAFVRNPDSTQGLALALSAGGQAGRSLLLTMPDARQFGKQLFPDSTTTQQPCGDVPLYPGSACRMQIGAGGPNFIGFYLTPDSIEQVRRYYAQEMARRGWRRATRPGLVNLEAFVKDDEQRSVLVNLRIEDDSSATRVGLVVSGPGRPTELTGR